eukprot:1875780-Heterocapsa_arctica.AAC.1
MAKRPKDLGVTCTGAPAYGTCRYWRKDLATLINYREGRLLTAGRNKPRTGETEQPVEPGQIIRLLMRPGEEASP